jgi:hypothetical protein
MRKLCLITSLFLILPFTNAHAAQPAAAGPDDLVPMAPCRVLDTRLTPAANPAEEAVRRIDIASTRCGKLVPTTATAYALRITSLNRSAYLNPAPVAAPQSAASRHPAGAPLNFPVAASAHIAVDLEGYYIPPSLNFSASQQGSSERQTSMMANPHATPPVQSEPSTVHALSNLAGTYGDIDVETGWNSNGILATAHTAKPQIAMRLGNFGTASAFQVINSNNDELFRTESQGSTRLVRPWSFFSGRTDYREGQVSGSPGASPGAAPGNIVHEVRIVNPK